MWNCNAKVVCWLGGGAFADVINFEIELNVSVFCLSLHFWRLGVMQVPIGKVMEVWTLRHQVVQISMNPSKRNFQKIHSLVLQFRSKRTTRNKEKTTVKHINCRLGLDMIWVRKPMKLCILANKLQWCIQAPKLANHWLVLMTEEVEAPVSNLPNARRV